MIHILIYGAGNIGSRYLQGLALYNDPIVIHVYDISTQSLDLAKQRWSNVVSSNTLHKVNYYRDLNDIPKNINIAIVSTNSNVRVSVVIEIGHRFDVHYWILEKILAQSVQKLDELLFHIKSSANVWVNTCRRMFTWYLEINNSICPYVFPCYAETDEIKDWWIKWGRDRNITIISWPKFHNSTKHFLHEEIMKRIICFPVNHQFDLREIIS